MVRHSALRLCRSRSARLQVAIDDARRADPLRYMLGQPRPLEGTVYRVRNQPTRTRVECSCMTKDYVLWNLQEAAEELSRTIQSLRGDADYGDPELGVAMSHLYHHLNTAWNARHATRAQVEECSAEHFSAWRQFPSDVDMTLV